MSDTPDKKDIPASESADSSEKKSPWFVTPMADHNEDEQDKIKLQPKQSEQPEQPEQLGKSEQPEKTEAHAKPAANREKSSAAPTPALAPAPKLKPGVKPGAKPKPAVSTVNPLAGGSITVDETAESHTVSTPMLVIDGLAAVVAIVFTVLILRDALPFL